MDSRIAYLNIRSILMDETLSTSTMPARGAKQRTPDFFEINRPLSVVVAKNNIKFNPTHLSFNCKGDGVRGEFGIGGAMDERTSHVTWEYQGVRAAFLACATFDGTGDHGTTIDRFAMPGYKLNKIQKALILLTLLSFSISNGQIKADFDFMSHKISADFDGGVSDLISQYNAITRMSEEACENILLAARGLPANAGSL